MFGIILFFCECVSFRFSKYFTSFTLMMSRIHIDFYRVWVCMYCAREYASSSTSTTTINLSSFGALQSDWLCYLLVNIKKEKKSLKINVYYLFVTTQTTGVCVCVRIVYIFSVYLSMCHFARVSLIIRIFIFSWIFKSFHEK